MFNEDFSEAQIVELEICKRFGGQVANAFSDYDLAGVPGYGFVEIKNDKRAAETNNLAIEYKGNKGQPSGIETTKSNHWFQVLDREIWIFKTEDLKALFQVWNLLPDGPSGEGAVSHLVPKAVAKLYVKEIVNR